MPSRSRTSICREGWYYVLLVVAVFTWAMLLEVNLLLIVAGMLCGPLVLGWSMPVAALRRVRIRRRAPRAMHAGESVTIEVGLRNQGRRAGAWAVVVRDRVCPDGPQPNGPPLTPSMFFPRLAAGATCRGTYRLHLPRRGRYRLGPLDVSTRFPFGLFRRTVTVETSDVLTVFPRLGRLTSAWSMECPEVVEGTQGAGRATRTPGEYFAVREWQSGDSVRWVHWRSTARHGTLVVRQFEQTRGRDVALLVDLWQPEDPQPQDLENVELAVSFVATVAVAQCRRQNSNLLLEVAGDRPTSVYGPTSEVLANEVLHALAVIRATSESDGWRRLEAALGRLRPNTAILVVTTRRTEPEGLRHLDAARAACHPAMALGRTYTISTADPKLAEYFRLE